MSDTFKPKLEYLRRVERGEIKMYHGPSASSQEWILWADGGMFQLIKYEDAGLVAPLATAKMAGYPSAFNRGVSACLTEKGKAMLSDCDSKDSPSQ